MNVVRTLIAKPTETASLSGTWRLLSTYVLMAAVLLFPLSANAAGLTVQQSGQANALSEDTHWPRARALAATHPLGLQTLSIEKQERKNQLSTRWVNVYQYHYTLQSARLLLIDLETDTVVKQSTINTVHLPLNNTEIAFAQSLLARDQDLITRLKLEQTRRNNTAFNSLTELDVKASIYEPMNPSHVCHIQRCALISLFDKTRTVFTIEPVVNLTTQEVEALHPQ